MLALRPFRWLDKQPASDLICKTVTCEILQLVHMYIMTKSWDSPQLQIVATPLVSCVTRLKSNRMFANVTY